jgi:hypothetical protein
VELQDYELDGFKMVLGWGKAVKLNAGPLPASQRTAADNAALDMLLPAAKQALGLPVPQPPPPFPMHTPVQGPAAMGYVPYPQPPTPTFHAPNNSVPSHSLPPPPGMFFPPGQPPAPSPWPAPPPPGLQPPAPVLTPLGAPALTMMPPNAVAGLPPPPFRAPPSQSAAPTVASQPTATQDLAHMSVDSFLDSIVSGASSAARAAPSTTPTAAVPPMFQKPPTAARSVGHDSTGFAQPPAPAAADVVVTVPHDAAQRALIDLMAKYCATDGDAFERVSLPEDAPVVSTL